MVVLDTGDPGAQVLPLPWAQTARRLMKRWGGERGEAMEVAVALYHFGLEVHPSSPELTRSALRWAGILGGWSGYDAQFPALAEQLGRELWTANGKLHRVARAADLDVDAPRGGGRWLKTSPDTSDGDPDRRNIGVVWHRISLRR